MILSSRQFSAQLRRLGAVLALVAVFALLLAHRVHAASARASWYGAPGEYLSRRTASGERFNPHALTAAHRSLPFGTRLRVSYRGRSVIVRVNDRGPARWTGRALDLSRAAAAVLGLTRAGVGRVSIERL